MTDFYNTSADMPIDEKILNGYFKHLVNKFFKILPMRENNEKTLLKYMQSLQAELLGFQHFVSKFDICSDFVTVLSVLQFLIDNPDCDVLVVRREVFKIISVCERLRVKLKSEVLCHDGLE